MATVQDSHEVCPPPLDEQSLDVELALLSLEERLDTLQSNAQLTRLDTLQEPEQIREGYLERYGFVTAGGYAYDAVVGMPRDQRTDIPVLATAAWFTSSRGHNEHAVRHLMRAGSPVIFVGSEGSYRPGNLVKPTTGITLAGSAAATLRFAQEAADQHHYLFDAQKRIVIGESRGAMTGLGMLSIDRLFDQEVVFADITAPCFPEAFAPIKHSREFLGYAVTEPISFAKVLAHLTLKQVKHYPATLDPHPYALAHQLAMGPALFSGEAGDLARLVPKNKLVHITCFNGDVASMQSEWQRIFVDHSNVRITPLEGSHLTIADPETLAYIEARNQAFHEEYAKDSELATGQQVFDRAHVLIRTSA